MIVIGLTGSIGMGKSTAAAMLGRLGVPCHDSDASVHELMEPEGKAYFAITAAFPLYSYPQIYKGKPKTIQRKALGSVVFSNPQERKKLEDILHPLVRESQKEFIRASKRLGVKAVVLDIPLLFETEGEKNVDVTVCVDAPPEIQCQRVMARPGMTEEKFASILDSQMPSAEKCARADYVIQTGLGRAVTMGQIKNMLREVLQNA